MDSNCSSLTDDYDSNDSDSLDFGSVTFKDDVAAPSAEIADNDDQNGEWDDDEFPSLDLNYEALTHIASCYLPGGHGNCVGIKELGRGDFNEIRLLEFEDGWSCIGRFARDPNETLAVLESEYATVKYVREHTTLPVPEVYFVNFDPTHVVGAPFMLIERMPGVSMYDIWDQIEEEHEVALIKQVADVLAELSKLQFDKIGSINIHGEVGELHSRAVARGSPARGPFDSLADYMCSFLSDEPTSSPELQACYPDITKRIRKYLADQTDDPIYNPPFRLIHPDFDPQNILFTWPDRSQAAPRLSGVLDWDYSFTGPLYDLFEYPRFLQDRETCEDQRANWPRNKILRQTFAQRLALHFPKGSDEREDARECFRQKCYLMNSFRERFTRFPCENAEGRLISTRAYGDDIGGRGSGLFLFPYPGRLDYRSDSEVESGDDDDDDGQDETQT